MELTRKKVDAILAGIKDTRVIVIGDLMLDRYVWGEVDRISPEAPVPIIRMQGESSNLGGAANVAANVSALGAEVVLFGIVGTDSEGDLLENLIDQAGFNNSGIVRSDSRPTIIKTRVIAGGQHVVRIDREVTSYLDHTTERNLLVRLRAALGGISSVILEDYNKGMFTESFISDIINSCREAGVPVGVDPKHENFWSYKGATLFKPNIRELETALARPLTDDQALEDAGKEVIERLELQHLLVTRGKEGMALFTDSEVHFLKTQAKKVHDVSGAGDTVIAALMAALGGTASIHDAANLANCAAGVVIAEVGAIPINIDSLRMSCS